MSKIEDAISRIRDSNGPGGISRSDVLLVCDELELYKRLYMRAVDAATPILQAGGRYSHLLLLGDSITERGIVALAEALDKANAKIAELLDEEKPLHKQHPNSDYCTFCHSQWPCEESL